MDLSTIKRKKWILNYLFHSTGQSTNYFRVVTTPSGIIRDIFWSNGDISEYQGKNLKELQKNHSGFGHMLKKPLPVYCKIVHFTRVNYKRDKQGPGFFSIFIINEIIEYCSHDKIDRSFRFRPLEDLQSHYFGLGYTWFDPTEF